MRRVTAVAAALLAACASIQAPPGAPERHVPPVLLSVTPDSGAVNARPDKVVFTFDEVVNDRPSGPALLENMFLVSPRQGAPDVSWKRDRIEVRAHKGFLPNTAYSVTMLPGITDQRGNVLRTGRVVVFSTGETIPPAFIYGRVFDWLREVPAPLALVEAILPDSTAYVGVADSSGQFAVGPMPRGTYVVRGVIDQNSNRGLDRGEAWDTLRVSVGDTLPFIELLAAVRDTLPPRIAAASATDSLTIAVTFDRPVETASGTSTAAYRIVGADSVALRVAAVLTKADAAARAAAMAPRDSTRPDSVTRANALPPALAAIARRVGAQPDTSLARAAGIKPSRPAPPTEIVVTLDPATPMHVSGNYRLGITGVRALGGATTPTERTFVFTPPPPPTTPAAPPGTSPAPTTATPPAPPAPPAASPPERR